MAGPNVDTFLAKALATDSQSLQKQADVVQQAEQKKVTDLEAKVVLLQELNDQKNPLEKGIKLEDENPKTAYEIQIGA